LRRRPPHWRHRIPLAQRRCCGKQSLKILAPGGRRRSCRRAENHRLRRWLLSEKSLDRPVPSRRTGVVGVGAIAGSGNALEFGDERAGQTSIRRVDQVDGRIARWQRLIYAFHIGGEKLRESSVQEQPFADGVFAGVDFTSDGKFGASPAPQLNVNGIAASPSSQNKMDFVERFILGFRGLALIATGCWTRSCLFLPNSSRRR
jgi:hypothetical protein